VVAAEREARRELVASQVVIDGQPVAVRHSRLDMGSVQEMLDGRLPTLGRFMEANPSVLEFRFDRPRPIRGVTMDLTGGTWEVEVRLQASEDGAAQVYAGTFASPVRDAHVELPIDRGPETVTLARVQIRHKESGEVAKNHVRELVFR
jgi:hypothetical protein